MINISIVVIEYHSLPEINIFISQIFKRCSLLNYEIIISSNSLYNKEKQKEIKERFPGVIWLFNEKNGGFAFGMNQGLKIAKGDYLIISNPDVKLLTNIQDLILFMEEHTEVGAVGPQIVDQKNIIQDSCRNYLTLDKFIIRNIKRIFLKKNLMNEDKIDYSIIQTVDWIIGAFIFVKRDVYLKTKGLDSEYFLYCEDIDWCTRIRQCGYEIVYYPHVKVEYRGSRTARSSFKYMKVFLKSLCRYWTKFGYLSISPKRKKIIY